MCLVDGNICYPSRLNSTLPPIHLCCRLITYATVNHPVMLIKWLSYEELLFARSAIELDLR